MKPYEKQLSTDTWFYAKRCIVAAIENIAKRIMNLPDSVLQSCLKFLEQCESKKNLYFLNNYPKVLPKQNDIEPATNNFA